ncbi:conserved hypothetical protein [Aspergillus terreus NIH2624]|uniref:Autophagy-related protein 29 n=1 Tax=Aspergillus terreus (strain NIH 2624 / FGSC A1156) TaxID=341663 RepID=Q0CX35_ASPTN|nr:uncharacterized protein ATEG_01749 [Aspergillus terreus NIH2624]EAU38506.1 conserved hypothetical protein [Aspergillus terreus NIH2624]
MGQGGHSLRDLTSLCSSFSNKQHGSTTDSSLRFGPRCVKSAQRSPTLLPQLRDLSQGVRLWVLPERGHRAQVDEFDREPPRGLHRIRKRHSRNEVSFNNAVHALTQHNTSLGQLPRRTSSSTTVNQVKTSRDPLPSESPATEAKEQKWASYGRRPSTGRREPAPAPHLHKSPTLEEEDLTSSPSESESDLEETTVSRRGPRFRHFGKFSTHRQGLRDDDEDDDESPAFLPVSRGPEHAPRESAGPDLNATLRMESEDPSAPRRRVEQNPIPRKSVTAESSTSSVSSGAPATLPSAEARRRVPPGTFSPRRAADLAHLSPRRSVASRDASDTPSMGSSFSDLDDASVTQSALEEALLSNMQHGGMASRMSTISQAIRSRYL